jgi:hypothetical protein
MSRKTKFNPKTKGFANVIKSFLKRESAGKKPHKTVLSGKKAHLPDKSHVKMPETTKTTDVKPGCFDPALSRKMAASNAPIRKKKNKFEASHSFLLFPKTKDNGPKYFFHSDIPDTYNETFMRAIPRDPEWLFVYWELSEYTMNELKRNMSDAEFGFSKKLLRLCDVTDIQYNGSYAWRYTDMEINRTANNWYIKIPESGRAYVVECGFLTSLGRFFLAVRSNVVNVPRIGLSPVLDQDWTTPSSDELIRMSADGFKRNLGASEKRFGGLAGETETAENFWGLSSGSGSGMFGMSGSGNR